METNELVKKYLEREQTIKNYENDTNTVVSGIPVGNGHNLDRTPKK